MADLIRTVARHIGRATGTALRTLAPGRHATVVPVAAEPDTALLATAAALRRAGARITRYEGDEAIVEARVGAALVSARAIAAGEITRVEVWTDTRGGRALLRRFRRELTRPGHDGDAPAETGGPGS
jgi:hypothetical protein